MSCLQDISVDTKEYMDEDIYNSQTNNLSILNEDEEMVHVNLSRCKLTQIPDRICNTDAFQQLKYLYLEGNYICRIPEEFFPTLKHLKWLDMRRNLLSEIPQAIANHSSMETLLLQENKLEKLPLELGLVPKLQGLQLSGNPIVFPPEGVLKSGVEDILEYLREEWYLKNQTDIRPIEGSFYTRTSQKEARAKRNSRARSLPPSLSQKKCREFKEKEKNNTSLLEVVGCPSEIVTVKPSLKIEFSSELRQFEQRKKSTKVKIQRPCSAVQQKTVKCIKKPRRLRATKKKPNEAKIFENLLKEMWIAKARDMLMKQEKIVEHMKHENALKTWRKESTLMGVGALDYNFSAPYHFDMNLSMPSRRSLQDEPDKMPKQYPASPKRHRRPMENEISCIVEALKQVHMSPSDASPEQQQQALGDEIQMLLSLQRRLQALKLRPGALPPVLVAGRCNLPSSSQPPLP